MIRLQRSFATAMPDLAVPHRAAPCPDARIVARSDDLARELGIDPAWLDGPEGLALLTGRIGPDGTPAPADGADADADAGAGAGAGADGPFTVAQVYAGHQFGQANPQLGDGRALLLGDLVDTRGHHRDLHLKGSGPTPLARGGDGWAPLGPMLRELLIGEAMHALGIATTRGLAVVETGRPVLRRGPVAERGAILARVATSHLRVGSFQFAAWHLGPEAVRDLVEHAIDRHWPQARKDAVPALGLLRCVMEAQARLVAQWMLVGFVHGVMNTDNMTISGETIDYGPCAFVDRFATDACFSSIDVQRRYAYGNQPGIALWNLSRLAEALLPVIDDDADAAVTAATAVLEGFEGEYLRAWTDGMARKLGIVLVGGPVGGAGSTDGADPAAATTRPAAVRGLGEDCLRMLQRHRIDLTGFFRALTDAEATAAERTSPSTERAEAGSEALAALVSSREARAELDAWLARRRSLVGDPGPAAALMASANPVVIPRNRHVDAALRAAELGDMAPFEHLLDAVRAPFVHHAGLEDLEGPGEDDGSAFVTYCGT